MAKGQVVDYVVAMPSATVENYLKRLYLLQQGTPGRPVAMGKLAGAMGVVPGTATTMVKALAESRLVAYEPRGGVRLTRAGERLALRVLRRHRLIELFLVRALGLDWSEVHDEAEELEHVISDKVLDRIDTMLGHPSTDPHGDPIPRPNGRLRPRPRVSLAEGRAKRKYRVAQVLDQGARFLQFAERHGLFPGAIVTIEAQDVVADAVRLRPEGKLAMSLGRVAAARILVEPIN